MNTTNRNTMSNELEKMTIEAEQLLAKNGKKKLSSRIVNVMRL
jgi:hypothetical protein